MTRSDGQAKKTAIGLAFIAPNIAGFLAFTLIPLVFSLAMAFTNWDVQLHNMFSEEPMRFVGFENFARLFSSPDFGRYFGNTLFFMMGIPFGMAGSLLAAILLSQDLRRGLSHVRWIAVPGMVFGVGLLMLVGHGTTAMAALLGAAVSLIFATGVLAGQTTYRTLFYFPHFTAGVATFLLWKKLYNPIGGPINDALRPVLSRVEALTLASPPVMVLGVAWLCWLLMAVAFFRGVVSLRRAWRDGGLGTISLMAGTALLTVPLPFALRGWASASLLGLSFVPALVAAAFLARMLTQKRERVCAPDVGIGYAVLIGAGLMIVQFALWGAGRVAWALPAMSESGLAPPEWLTQYHWAKPALMFMGLWAAVGSNNMILYLAGLANVPVELYEAAQIDGASPMQRFWHVTWPQLAPVTFFIFVMSVIGGLQGGFEMARTMTRGGPAGATTTLSYYVYTEGFQSGRMGYASAAAWTIFALVFAITMFNWKFGNRYVNE